MRVYDCEASNEPPPRYPNIARLLLTSTQAARAVAGDGGVADGRISCGPFCNDFDGRNKSSCRTA
ncbi:hypothetical protein CDEST_00195 [Colletotrichum destructivum]|uniref:Uncharacterized protein n=1 Tax=Colletotrichum destructivum TaxID=34406 RepID=A0AAX4HWC7_9PEZI|nr:hypothetical protein CDEST_00195 [Colletotrichum destructivum]